METKDNMNGNKKGDIRHTNDRNQQEQHSSQENRQDLDQQQQVDVNPSQVNVQKIDLVVNNKLENYSGKISGVIYINNENTLVEGAEIFIYFGTMGDYPVFKTNSDKNGCYSVEDLPPGFYSIKVVYENFLSTKLFNIKVLPGQNCYQPLLLTEDICDQ